MAAAPRRELGATEANWLSACDAGTGITLVGLWMNRDLSKSSVQLAVDKLVNEIPYLSTRVVTSQEKKHFFELAVNENAIQVREAVNPFLGDGSGEGQAEDNEYWTRIVELEMNTTFPSTKESDSFSVFEVRLYTQLRNDSSLVVFRAHPVAFDMASLDPIACAFLEFLRQAVQREQSEQSGEESIGSSTVSEDPHVHFEYLPCVESAIPQGAADKPFWAKGIDVIGYGLVSRKHAYLPFSDASTARKSRLIRAALPRDATIRLMRACEEHSANLYGAVSAALQIAVAEIKNVGQRGEHYGAAVLYNCRAALDPVLPPTALGFYHSAMLKTTHVTPNHRNSFWTIAADLTRDFQAAIKSKKHFRDMGDLSMLMMQAIYHPGLTPSSSLRTALFSMMYDAGVQTCGGEAAEFLKLNDFVYCASNHGVGGCVALFHFLRDEELHCSFVYPSPLFTHPQIQSIIDATMELLSISS